MAMLDKAKVEAIAARWAPAFTDVQLDQYTAQIDMFCEHTGLSALQVVTVGGWLCARAAFAGDEQSMVVCALVSAAAIRTVEQGAV